jgi:hypothetical protein
MEEQILYSSNIIKRVIYHFQLLTMEFSCKLKSILGLNYLLLAN